MKASLRSRLLRRFGHRRPSLGKGLDPPPSAPVLSVVVPVYNVAPFLGECLDSVLGQSLRDLEVIAVDDGSTDDSLTILREYERRDPRVQILTQPNSGQGIARNRGVALARGEFLTFCDSDDTVPPNAYRYMLNSLRASGSDFAVGAARRFKHDRPRQVSQGRTVHEVDRTGVRLDDFLPAMKDIIACNRMFRTEFWTERVGDFRGHIAYEDHVPMLAAYVRAESFDVLSRVTYNWRVREDHTSTGQQKVSLDNLLDRIAVKDEAHRLLVAEASPAVYDAWVARCIEIDFPPYLRYVTSASDLYRNILAATYTTFLGRATEQALHQVQHRRKVTAWLCAERRWDDLTAAEEHFRSTGEVPRVRVEGARLLAVPDESTDLARIVPPQLWELSPDETAMQAAVKCVEVDARAMTVAGYAIIRGLGTAERGPEIEAWLVDLESGTRVDLPVVGSADPETDQWAEHQQTRYDHSAFSASIDLSHLAERSAGLPAAWVLRLRLTQEGVTREGGAHYVVDGSPAGRLRPSPFDGDLPLTVTPVRDSEHGFLVRLESAVDQDPPARSPELLVRDARLVRDHLVIDVTPRDVGDLEGATLEAPHARLGLAGLERRDDVVQLSFDRRPSSFGGTPTPAPSGGYRLSLATAEGHGPCATAEPAFARRLPYYLPDEDHGLVVRVRRDGEVRFVLRPPLAVEERRPAVQSELQRTHRRPAGPASWVARDSLLLNTERGTVADSPLALDAYLAQASPGLVRYWGVRDRSERVPDGAVPVVIGSGEWYDALRSAPRLCTSGDLPDFFVGRPEQRVLQTFDGYPDRPIGRSAWRAKNFAPTRTELEIARLNQQWDAVLAPNAQTAELYRTEYDYRGEVLVTGYPRCDALVTGDRDAIRADVLERLGVPAGLSVVLHAPAHRNAATSARLKGESFDTLDLDELARLLGPEHAVLTLGADPIPSTPVSSAAAHVVDVSAYPRINDLLHTADAAVLDYSNLRFDWALTRRPAVFFTPDLEAYLEAVPSPIDFESTSPGPRATTTSEVAALLLDERVGDGYAERVEQLNHTWNALHDGRATERVVNALYS